MEILDKDYYEMHIKPKKKRGDQTAIAGYYVWRYKKPISLSTISNALNFKEVNGRVIEAIVSWYNKAS